MTRRNDHAAGWGGLAAFLVLTYALAWAPLFVLREVAPRPAAVAGAAGVLWPTLLYLLTMGWQPPLAVWLVRRYVDREAFVDHGLRPARRPHALVALAGALWLVVASSALAHFGHPAAPAASPPVAPPGVAQALLLSTSVLAVAALVWVQAVAEEVGWRGYFLARLRLAAGPWAGLLLQGAAWGLWYAPFIALANQSTLAPGLWGALGFVLTATLLGTLLGALRLVSRSVLPPALANGLLTALAGLPLIVAGTDVGLRGAVFGVPGWLPLALALAALLAPGVRAQVGRLSEADAAPRAPAPLAGLFSAGPKSPSLH